MHQNTYEKTNSDNTNRTTENGHNSITNIENNYKIMEAETEMHNINNMQSENNVGKLQGSQSKCQTTEEKYEEHTNNTDFENNFNIFKIPKKNVPDNLNESENKNGNADGMQVNQHYNKSEKDKNKEKSRIIRNVIMVSIAFMVHFTAFAGTSNLQSSVNAAEGLGTTSLMTIYVGMGLSSIFLPVVLIKWLGCKWTLVVTMVAYIPYIAAQMYAEFFTLIPAAVLIGLGAGPLWCAQGVYIKIIAEIYAELLEVPPGTIVARFFGIFFMIYQTSEIWGNLISSAVFSASDFQGNKDNDTIFKDLRGISICGYNFCPGSEVTEKNPNLERPPEENIYIVASTYLACMIIACLIIVVGVTSLKTHDEDGRSSNNSGETGLRLLVVTIKLLSDYKLLLLLPLTIWMGIEQVFRGADFTVGYVSCAWGISNIGYVLICYGITNSVASLLTGYLVKLTGRLLMVLLATAIQISITVTLYVWLPDPTITSTVFFIVSGLWGITDAVWLVQISALYGTLFSKSEAAAYSNFRLWKSVGFIMAYAYSPYLCTSIKLHILLTMLIIGAFGFCIIEWLQKTHVKK